MTEPQRDEYRRLRVAARAALVNLVDALNRRDTLDGELGHSRHPLPPARMEYLTTEAILAHRRCEHLQMELDAYAIRLTRLARELQIDEFEDDERGARSAKRGASEGPAMSVRPPAPLEAPPPTHQLGLFA